MLKLSEEHYDLAQYVLARTVSLPNWSPQDQEDMLQEAYLGLVQAARTYDPNKAASFRTFATHRVRGAVRDWLRKAHPMARHYRTHQPAPPAMCEFLPELLPAPSVNPDLHIYISQLLAPLTPRQRTAFCAWAIGYRHWEIGEALGLSESRITQIIKEAREISGNGHKGPA